MQPLSRQTEAATADLANLPIPEGTTSNLRILNTHGAKDRMPNGVHDVPCAIATATTRVGLSPTS